MRKRAKRKSSVRKRAKRSVKRSAAAITLVALASLPAIHQVSRASVAGKCEGWQVIPFRDLPPYCREGLPDRETEAFGTVIGSTGTATVTAGPSAAVFSSISSST